MTRVAEHLDRLGIRFRVLPHPAASSALGEALALGVDPDDVAKAVLLDPDDGHVLAIVPASRRLDVDLVRQALGEDHVHLASEAEIEHDFPEYELGALSPLPALLHILVLIDPMVLATRRVTLAAGTQSESVQADSAELFTGANVTVAPITGRPAGTGEA